MKQGATDGVLWRWGQALAKELRRPFEPIFRPSQRLERTLLRNEADILCHTHPDWLDSATIHALQWPRHTFFDEVQVVVAGPDSQRIEKLGDLRGTRVGLVLGYRYKALDKALATDSFERSNAVNESQLSHQLLLGRVDYAVLNSLTVSYQGRSNPKLRSLQITPIEVERKSLYCVLSPRSRVSLEEFEHAQSALLGKGEMAKILDQFR